MADLEASDTIVSLFVHKPGRKLVVAASDGNGFVVPEDECIATTRKGKQNVVTVVKQQSRLIQVEEVGGSQAVEPVAQPKTTLADGLRLTLAA